MLIPKKPSKINIFDYAPPLHPLHPLPCFTRFTRSPASSTYQLFLLLLICIPTWVNLTKLPKPKYSQCANLLLSDRKVSRTSKMNASTWTLTSEMDDLIPFVSPFPDASRGSSTPKSLFCRNRQWSRPQVAKKKSLSPKGFKKTSGSLEDLGNISVVDSHMAYLEEDDEFCFREESQKIVTFSKSQTKKKRFFLF